MGDDDQIDWTQELISAGVPEAKEALPVYKNGLKKRAVARAIADIINNYGNNKLLERNEKNLTLK